MNQKSYYDIINGNSHPYTWEEVLDTVRENPYSNNPDENFFFDEDNVGYSCQEIADILGIELEIGED